MVIAEQQIYKAHIQITKTGPRLASASAIVMDEVDMQKGTNFPDED